MLFRSLEVREGAYLGLVDGTPVTTGDELQTVALAVVEKLLEGDRGWLGILTGDAAPPLDGIVSAIRDAHPGLDVEVNEGGQPHYPLLLAAE